MKKVFAIVGLVGILALTLLPAAVGAQTLDLGLGYAQATGLGTQDVRETISNVIRAAMGLLGIVCVIIILYGGFLYMTSAGEKEKTEKARKVIMAGVIGLVIIVSAYAISAFIIDALMETTA